MSKPKKKKTGAGGTIVIIVALAVIAFSLFKLIPILLDYYKAEAVYNELEEQYVEVGEVSPDDSEWWYTDVTVDMAALKEINRDVIGWIRFDDTDAVKVDYPILYSGDDQTYLHQNIHREPYSSGCIFLEGENKPDFSDVYNIIYGHNMRNLSMFGSLKAYKQQEDFYENNKYFTIYTEDMAYRFEIFSYHDTQDGSDVYTVGYVPDEEFQTFVDRLSDATLKDTGIRPTKDDMIVTLSTCTSRTATERFVIHAVLIDQHSYTTTDYEMDGDGMMVVPEEEAAEE